MASNALFWGIAVLLFAYGIYLIHKKMAVSPSQLQSSDWAR